MGYSPQGHKESDTTKVINNSNNAVTSKTTEEDCYNFLFGPFLLPFRDQKLVEKSLSRVFKAGFRFAQSLPGRDALL